MHNDAIGYHLHEASEGPTPEVMMDRRGSHIGDQSSKRNSSPTPGTSRGGTVRVPEALLVGNHSEPGHYGFVILGAGCAGLSFCYYLLEQGVEAPILILDQKSGFEDDRTWCFWDVEETPFSHLATRRWNSWSLYAGGDSVLQTSDENPYMCLTGADFYRYALERISTYPNVTLRLGEGVEDYKEHAGITYVRTPERTYTADYVLDGRGLLPGSQVFEEARKKARWVPQRFLGLRLRTNRPVFDPEVCTLMDFSVSQDPGPRFMYVLPFGEHEALVENVYLADGKTSREEHYAELSEYLDDRYGLGPGDYTVDGEERGYIPMTDYRFPRRLGERAYSIGMLGGETRPSTGYTFLRIQRYCRSLAESLVQYGSAPRNVHPGRLNLLDGIFLRYMLEHPEKLPEIYRRMFAGLGPEYLIRFLTERSTPADELRLVIALPKAPFIKIAGRMLFGSRTES